MARQLWLLRHADAEPHGTRTDALRRLTARGERQARIAGIALRNLGVDFERVLVSPKVRAQRTAAIAAEQWTQHPRAELETHPALAEEFDAQMARAELAGTEANSRLLLVGHEPDLSRLAGDLTGARLDLKKGGLAVLRLDGTTGELILLMRPRELARLVGEPDIDV